MFHNLIENKWFILAPLTAILAVSLIIVSMRYKYIGIFIWFDANCKLSISAYFYTKQK